MYVTPPAPDRYILVVEDYLFIFFCDEEIKKMIYFSPDQSYISVQINSNRCSARTFGNNTIIEISNTIEIRLVSQKPVACIPSRYFYMHASDCRNASCITGVVYITQGVNASFEEETVFANNTAEFRGTAVTCTRFCECHMTTNQTFPARGCSGKAASKKATSRSAPPLGHRTCM